MGCLLVEKEGAKMFHPARSGGGTAQKNANVHNPSLKVSFDIGRASPTRLNSGAPRPLGPAETSLIDHICRDERERRQLRLLAHCIGFDASPGPRGDLGSFRERRRLHIVSTALLRQRMQLNSHAVGLEESRNWSRLFTDADTVFARDVRSGGDLVLTVGDSRIVTVSFVARDGHNIICRLLHCFAIV